MQDKTDNRKTCCERMLLRSIDKARYPDRTAVVMRCRRCGQSGVETFYKDANSQSVYVRRTFQWF